jgi:hypothetical protein
MTTDDTNIWDLAPVTTVSAGAQSAGTTTVLRQCMSELTVRELIRADPVVQSLLHPIPGVLS